MEDKKNELATSHNNSDVLTAGFLIPETAYGKIKALSSQLRLLSELAQRPDSKEIIITAQALEDTFLLIESELQNVLSEAKFFSHH